MEIEQAGRTSNKKFNEQYGGEQNTNTDTVEKSRKKGTQKKVESTNTLVLENQSWDSQQNQTLDVDIKVDGWEEVVTNRPLVAGRKENCVADTLTVGLRSSSSSSSTRSSSSSSSSSISSSSSDSHDSSTTLGNSDIDVLLSRSKSIKTERKKRNKKHKKRKSKKRKRKHNKSKEREALNKEWEQLRKSRNELMARVGTNVGWPGQHIMGPGPGTPHVGPMGHGTSQSWQGHFGFPTTSMPPSHSMALSPPGAWQGYAQQGGGWESPVKVENVFSAPPLNVQSYSKNKNQERNEKRRFKKEQLELEKEKRKQQEDAQRAGAEKLRIHVVKEERARSRASKKAGKGDGTNTGKRVVDKKEPGKKAEKVRKEKMKVKRHSIDKKIGIVRAEMQLGDRKPVWITLDEIWEPKNIALYLPAWRDYCEKKRLPPDWGGAIDSSLVAAKMEVEKEKKRMTF